MSASTVPIVAPDTTGDDMPPPPQVRFTAVISLGSLLSIVSILAVLASGIWQAAEIRASLEAGLRSETAIREANTSALSQQISAIREDIRDLRAATRQNPQGGR